MTVQKSKRIVTNTLLLFMRMFAITIINLYAVRVVQNAIGKVDYGIFYLIAGVVLISSFLSATLAISVQRFYSFTMGEAKPERLQDIFSTSINVVFVIVLVILLIAETFGVWFVDSQLVIPPDRIVAARWIFQFALISFVCSFFQIPYTAAIFAHEDMGLYAVVSFIECVLKLTVALLIGMGGIDGLIFYGFGLAVVAIFIFLLYAMVCRRRYMECHYRRQANGGEYKELLAFSGWTMYGVLANVGIMQGNVILLNLYFAPIVGTVINTAYGIANQVYNALLALANSIVIAFRPVMIKSYAEKNFVLLDHLFYASTKSIYYLLLAVSLPAIAEIRIVFDWWLESYTEDTILFTRLFIVYMVCISLNSPITTVIQADGRVRNYFLWVETFMILCIPVSCVLFHFGFPAYGIFVSMISVCLIAHLVRLIYLHYHFRQFSLWRYFSTFVLPGLLALVLGSVCAIGLHRSIEHLFCRFLVVVTALPVVVLVLAYLLGTSRNERLLMRELVGKIIKR